MSWEKVKLGDIIQIKKGAYITKKESTEGPYPVILGGQEPAYYIDTFNHTGKAIVISRSGASAGYVSFWNEPIFVTDGFLIEPKGGVDIDFLYLLLKSRQAELQGKQGGAAIPHVNPRTINAIEVMLPSTPIQERVTLILSTYEDLIKNNQKQIKLLEEAAQRLYKEWFVDLRFPGHETTPITDGIPEEWSMEELRNIATLKAGGDKPKVFSKEKSSNCNVPVFSNGTENEGLYGYTNQAEILDPCVTISARGSVGYTCLRKTAFVPIVRLISVIPTRIEVEYLYYFLKNMVFESNGAAQQQITVPMIKNKQVLLPSKTVMGLFVSQVRPMMDLRECLKGKIMSLCEARDRLLPKLMSEEIEV